MKFYHFGICVPIIIATKVKEKVIYEGNFLSDKLEEFTNNLSIWVQLCRFDFVQGIWKIVNNKTPIGFLF